MELLVYTAIIGFVLAFVIGGMLGLNRSVIEARASRDLNISAVTALERMAREIKDATGVVTASSTLGTSPGTLTISTTNASTTGGTMSFSVSGNKLVLTQGGVATPLTASNVGISRLAFYSYSATNSDSVRIELWVYSTSTGTSTRKFYDTAVLRESYVQ